MKTTTRYFIVCIVMVLFVAIVAYLFIGSAFATEVKTGPCGNGKCSDNVVHPPVSNSEHAVIPVVNEESIFTQPVVIPPEEEEEEAPNIIAHGVNDNFDKINEAMALGLGEFMEALKDSNVIHTESYTNDESTIIEIESDAESNEEHAIKEVIVKSETPVSSCDATDEMEVKEPVVDSSIKENKSEQSTESEQPPQPEVEQVQLKKRRGRPPSKGIHGKKSQQVVNILSDEKNELNVIDEEE